MKKAVSTCAWFKVWSLGESGSAKGSDARVLVRAVVICSERTRKQPDNQTETEGLGFRVEVWGFRV